MPILTQLPGGSVCWPAASLPSAARDVRHARTDVRRPRGSARTLAGTTRWEGRQAGVSAWMEWGWIEVGDGTVVQADPLAVRSNVLLLDERGRPLLSPRLKAALATLVYLLPWQGPVLAALRAAEPRLAA
ncbi:MAG: hypothetical protein QM788_15135 [Roseateles sp.]|uniref:hypothetical protein n=1 Tax=Roseateles sp. TaxID=1971397 RepID=UPI0039EA26B7